LLINGRHSLPIQPLSECGRTVNIYDCTNGINDAISGDSLRL
jgi:hypothetical protein